MVDEQAQVALGPVEPCDRQVGLSERRASDRERVDRIALAGLPGTPSRTRHQLGWDPHDRLAGDHEIGLEPPAEVPAVLERPAPVGPADGPASQLEMPLARGGDGLLVELAPGLVDHHDRVAPLVQICAQDDHVPVSSSYEVTNEDRSADTPEWGRCHAPIKSRRPVRRA
jgi:hypothetical protein